MMASPTTLVRCFRITWVGASKRGGDTRESSTQTGTASRPFPHLSRLAGREVPEGGQPVLVHHLGGPNTKHSTWSVSLGEEQRNTIGRPHRVRELELAGRVPPPGRAAGGVLEPEVVVQLAGRAALDVAQWVCLH